MTDRKKREAVHQIVDLMLDINGVDKRKRSLTGNKPTAMLYFFGHTADIEVDVNEKGWEEGEEEAERRFSAFLYHPGEIYQMIAELETFKEELEGRKRRGGGSRFFKRCCFWKKR